MLQAGMAYDGKDLAAFFERIGAYPNGHNSQCRFMTGYCSMMAKTDPLGAMKFYGEMCHPKKITNAGLEKVMEYVQPNADYLAIATVIKEDNAGLSKNTRRSLLNNWSQHKPAEAAQYVMSNTSVVHADQMAVVMKQWAQQDPEQAAAWIAGWDGSDHKDQGCLILAQTLKLAKPADAFVMASHISNFELKVKTATEAFNEWAKTDRKAAEAAWVEVFPQ
jgi:predicted house-cleaning NTP pyrophosphatase (Maf/HAM1 superfamily)